MKRISVIERPSTFPQMARTVSTLLKRASMSPEYAGIAAAEVLSDQERGERWIAAMLRGDFEAAWRQSDALRTHGAPDPHRLWNGAPLHGEKLIVRCLHGLGDTVQMLGYASHLNQIAGSLTFEVPPRLLPLMPLFRGVTAAVTWGSQAPQTPIDWNAHIEVMELPYIFRTTLRNLPLATDYLELPEALLSATHRRMGTASKPRVGLVWASGEWNPARSINPLTLRPLLELRNVECWNLQGGQAHRGLQGEPLHDARTVCGDGLIALAATIAHLDLVITVDTLAAHLAGALGKPVWLMLQHAADWRWMTARDRSPWYPSMRILRQPAPDDWPSVVGMIEADLRAW